MSTAFVYGIQIIDIQKDRKKGGTLRFGCTDTGIQQLLPCLLIPQSSEMIMLYVRLTVCLAFALHRRHHLFVSSFIVQQKDDETNQKLRSLPYTRKKTGRVGTSLNFLQFMEGSL